MTALVNADNVRETSVSTGTGDFTLNGASGAVTTAAIGRTFNSVMSTNNVFHYTIQHKDLNEWEVGLGKWIGTNSFVRERVITSSNNNAAVNFSAGTKVVLSGPTSEIYKQLLGNESIEFNGAMAGQDNTIPVSTARSRAGVNFPITAGPTDYTHPWGVKTLTSLDFVADQLGEGTAFSLSQGTDAAPSQTSSPIVYIEKTTQGHATNQNDHGCIDVRVKKVGGSNNTYGVFAAAEAAGGGGFVTPFFSICKSSDATVGYVTGSRIYVNKSVAMDAGFLTGQEIILADTSGQDAGWMDTNAANSTTGISVLNDPGRGTFGIRVSTGTAGNGFYTGVLLDQDSVMPTSFSGTAEALRIKGGSTAAKKYGGLWLQSGNFSYGINLVGPTFDNNAAILMAKDSRITFGTSTSSSAYAQWTSADFFNINQGSYAVNGTKVLGSRITGWGSPSGTATRTGFATGSVTTAQLAEAVKALIDDLKTHGLIGT